MKRTFKLVWSVLAVGMVGAGICNETVAAVADAAVLRVRGRGAEGRNPYRGGGAVRFLDVRLPAQVLHLQDDGRFLFPLRIRYEVLEPAPICLSSRLGTEYWRFYHFHDHVIGRVYTDEKVDLSKPGVHEAQAQRARWVEGGSNGARPGLIGVRGRSYFLIDGLDGRWIDVVDPPPFFDDPALARRLTFTLADLSRYEVSVEDFECTWTAHGWVRVKLWVRDAQGREFPVVNASATVQSQTGEVALQTEWELLNQPTGWLIGRLPEAVPDQLELAATVWLQTPRGLETAPVKAVFAQGQGRVSPDRFAGTEGGVRLPRNAQGKIRETRAIWASPQDMKTRAQIHEMVRQVKEAGLNMILPDIFVRNTFLAKSPLMPKDAGWPEDFDPLAVLLREAHAVGLEVHPWFCVTYRDEAFRQWFREARGVDITMRDAQGRPIARGADVHARAYRDFVVELMGDVAARYEVDGIHLDYIRSMGQCWCERCQREFTARFGKPMSKASEQEWIAWQRSAIGDIVQRTATKVRRVRPGAILSAAVFASLEGGARQGQDPAEWTRRGWLDVVMPMDYQMQSLQVLANEQAFLEVLDDDDRLVTGLSLYMRVDGRPVPKPPALVREQVELVRRLGIHGYCLFAYSYLDDKLLELLRDTLNTEPAVPFFRN